MFNSIVALALLANSIAVQAAPIGAYRRTVTSLDQAAVAEAQPRDDTATRAFTATAIKSSDGTCLSVDPLSGDFRENLTPVTSVKCDGSKNQQWDVITAGKHNNVAGQALIVSSLTNACLNFDPRRAAGNQVLLFSCGGRADGGGNVVNSQQFAFTSGSSPIALTPLNGVGKVCLFNKNGVLDQQACDAASASGAELFSIGGAAAAAAPAKASPAAPAAASPAITPAPKQTSATPTTSTPSAVSRAGGVLNPSAAAEANPVDTTAVKAFSKAQVKTADGHCLSIDPSAGDFRENLIPVKVAACDDEDEGQQFDVVTSGKHNDTPGQALIVSSLTQGCLNFDPRRAAGDQVIMFSCGGRADGGGLVTNSQQFSFSGSDGKTPFPLAPLNGNGKLCLSGSAETGVLNSQTCDVATATGDELFTIVA